MSNPFDYQPIPKLPKGRPPKPARFTRKSDGREVYVCRTRAEDELLRRRVFDLYEGHCTNCGQFAPFHHEVDEETGTIRRFAGEKAHITPRRAGGGDRDDSIENLTWKCHSCHGGEHRPKAVPRKVRA